MTFIAKMAAPTKMEFAVEMTCQGCENTVKKSLDGVPGINSVEIHREKEQVIVESSLPSSRVKDLIETTGKRAVLQGYGSNNSTPQHLGAAVAIMEVGSSLIKGVVRFVQSSESTCVVDGSIDGLPPGTHTVCVHQLGDISDGCASCGSIIGFGLTEKVKGIITELQVGTDGQAVFKCHNEALRVWDLIGRSMVIHQGAASTITRDNSNRLVCGIIARSAGLFENTKKFCACDGVTIWEERNKPVAGVGRQSNGSS